MRILRKNRGKTCKIPLLVIHDRGTIPFYESTNQGLENIHVRNTHPAPVLKGEISHSQSFSQQMSGFWVDLFSSFTTSRVRRFELQRAARRL